MARLFISYKNEEQAYAFALRQWLMQEQGWCSDDIFLDVGHLHTGVEWERKLLGEAEAAEVMLFLASDRSLEITSFCYRELQHAKGQILSVTIGGVRPDDHRLVRAIPDRARSRQITALDQEPTRPFAYVSPKDNRNGSVQLNGAHVEGIGRTLRDLGVAPESFHWTSTLAGPYPGLRALQEGDEALFAGRDIEIRDGIKALEDLRASVTQRVLAIQAPSGAGKSSFLRAGLWQRLRRHSAFTPLAIVRAELGLLHNEDWGFASGLFDTLRRQPNIGRTLPLSRQEILARAGSDLVELLEAMADADKGDGPRRTLLVALDQAEELSQLSGDDAKEAEKLLRRLISLPETLDLRFVLTVRDDSLDVTLERLAALGLAHEAVSTFRLHRMPQTRFEALITAPALAADRAGWPLQLDPKLVGALSAASASGGAESGDALPILALALQKLVARYRRPDGQVELPPDEAPAFVEGAVTEAMNVAIKHAGATHDDFRRLMIPQLATWDPNLGGGAAKRQVASTARLFAGDRARLRSLADELVAQRLLVTSGSQTGANFEVAHEALLRTAPLNKLILDRREQYEQARLLEIEVRDWAAAPSTARLARSGQRLQDAQALLKDEDFGADLRARAEQIEAYLAACAAHETETRDRLRRLVGRAFVKPAEQALATGRPDAALRMAAAGLLLSEDVRGEITPELVRPALRAAAASKLLARLDGHTKEINSAAFSPDGTWIVTASNDNTARIWDAAMGAEIRRLEGHTKKITSATFSPDGTRIVTASWDSTARIWDAATGAEIGRLEAHEGSVNSAAFSPDGTRIVTASVDTTARIWDAAIGAEIRRFEALGGSVNNAAFSPDGTRIVTASWDNTAQIWDAATGAEIGRLEGLKGSVNSATFSPDGTRIVTASDDNTARIWDAATGAEIRRLEGHTKKITSATFSPDGTRIVTASWDSTARIWDAATGAEIGRLEAHEGSVNSAAFSPDGTRIVTASVDTTARIWDAAIGAEIRRFDGHGRSVTCAMFSPDGTRIVTASSDQTARIWDAAKGAELHSLKGHRNSIASAAFSPDGSKIVTASEEQTARIWEAASSLGVGRLIGHGRSVTSAAFSPDGTRIVTASDDNTARIWDAAMGAEIRRFEGHRGSVNSAAFSPDGTRIVTASNDNTARIWDAATGAEIRRLEGHEGWVSSAAFSSDGTRIVTASNDQTARIWDAAMGAEIRRLEGHEGSVKSAAFSPDGTRIVTASNDKTARIWDAAMGVEIGRLEGHKGWVNSAAFSPDGTRIVTASWDNTARIWNVSRSRALTGDVAESLGAALACGIGRLNKLERKDFLLQEAPPDLFTAWLALCGDKRHQIFRRAQILRKSVRIWQA